LGKNIRPAAIALLVTLGSVATLAAGTLRISSPSFEQNAVVPPQFTCDGAGTSPPLQFNGAPPGTRSLVLIVVDPDVPRSIKPDGRFLHWAVWDLAATRKEFAEGQRALGLNENGPGGYIPACPPNGEHRYVFQLYAINSVIGKASISNEADLRRAMEGHILDQAELVGRYTTRAFRSLRMAAAGVVAIIALAVIYRVWSRRRALAASR
jgi:Raf kinase inhibitor-like YbhB/YbcL family protein